MLRQTWQIRRRNGRIAPDTLVVDYGYFAPPVNVFSIARRLGVELRVSTNDPSTLNAECLIVHEAKAYIVVTRDRSDLQQRFAIAHMLGRLLLHPLRQMRHGRSLSDETLYWRELRTVLRTDQREEMEANRFAAHLLMPSFMLQTQEPGLSISALARRFDVSRTAMNLRLYELYGLAVD